ncbi:MAG: hypothetical protein AAF206_08705 [Bacteroidota bacterium]
MKRKVPTWIYILIPFLAIATCNYIINTQDEDERFNQPRVGDYYAFSRLIQDEEAAEDQVLKLAEIGPDSMTFFLPMQEFPFGFQISESESVVRDADKNGSMFSPYIMKVSRADLLKYRENGSLSLGNAMKYDQPKLIKVFR